MTATVPAVAPEGRTSGPPDRDDLRRWTEADRAARPARLARLRERMSEARADLYLAVRRENIRYLTGFALGDGEEKVAGNSGRSLISADEVVVLADSRYTIQAREEAPGARIEGCGYDLPARWRDLLAGLRPSGRRSRIRRVAVEASVVPHGLWLGLRAAAPEVELVEVDGWVEESRQVKEPAEIERIEAACRLGDAALQALLASIEPGVTEGELAWELEAWLRTHGAEALAFDVAVLAGPRAAMPHGSPTERPVRRGEVLLIDFGAQVAGYRSDMTRTLFVGEPSTEDRRLYDIVFAAQQAALELLESAAYSGDGLTGRAADRSARQVIEEAGYAERFGHNLGHGIGLATHELPGLNRAGPETELPSPTVFSVEPGIYLDGETGVRIEDLVLYDLERSATRMLTHFPREVMVVGA